MSEISDLRERLAVLIRRCEDVLDATEQHGPKMVGDNVRRNVDAFALSAESHDQLMSASSAILEKVVSQTRRVLMLQKSMADALGDPDRLRAAAQSINDRVAGSSRTLADQVRPSALIAMNNSDLWNGPGAEGYARSLVGQDDAVRHVAVVGAEIEHLLAEFAGNIEQYYSTLLTTVGRLYGALLAIAGTVATGPTGVGPLRAIASSVASLVDTLIEQVQKLTEKNAAIEVRLRELDAEVGTWPSRNS
ncbi:MAG: hypothetical protein ACOH1T_07210 [Microbacteriaceae bacterium]